MKPPKRIPRRSKNYARRHKANLKNKRERQKRKESPDIGVEREKAYERANGRCEKCGRRADLAGEWWIKGEAHHVVFRSHGGEDTAENLLWLCHRCHRAIHDGEKPVPSKKSLASVSDVCIMTRHEEIPDVSPGSDVEAARKDAS